MTNIGDNIKEKELKSTNSHNNNNNNSDNSQIENQTKSTIPGNYKKVVQRNIIITNTEVNRS